MKNHSGWQGNSILLLQNRFYFSVLTIGTYAPQPHNKQECTYWNENRWNTVRKSELSWRDGKDQPCKGYNKSFIYQLSISQSFVSKLFTFTTKFYCYSWNWDIKNNKNNNAFFFFPPQGKQDLTWGSFFSRHKDSELLWAFSSFWFMEVLAPLLSSLEFILNLFQHIPEVTAWEEIHCTCWISAHYTKPPLLHLVLVSCMVWFFKQTKYPR